MTQEEKELLLRDLCARLPYGVMCNRIKNHYKLVDIDIKRGIVYLLREEQYVPYSITLGDKIEPYLRPMESMTEEEREEYINITHAQNWLIIGEADKYFDWLNAHHFDYRGLIEKGLALPALEGMYKTVL